MKTIEVPSLVESDGDAVIACFRSGKPLDPEIARRIDERADRITELLRQKYGTLNVSADLVREGRSEE